MKNTDIPARVGDFYNRSSPWFSDRRYFNQGYWANDPKSWDEASTALAQLLGELAGLAPGQRVVDAGFGWGEQDLYWLDVFKPAQILGLNLSAGQVEWATEHLHEHGYGERVDFRVASATQMPLRDACCDRVVALESAHHFDTRADFFAEAYRVLKPGGRLAICDIVVMPTRADDLGRMFLEGVMRAGNDSMMPRANIQDRHELGRDLFEVGFVGIEIVSIREHVYAPAARWLARQLRAGTLKWRPEYLDNPAQLLSKAGLEHRMFYWTVLSYLNALSVGPLVPAIVRACDHGVLDYVVVVANKERG